MYKVRAAWKHTHFHVLPKPSVKPHPYTQRGLSHPRPADTSTAGLTARPLASAVQRCAPVPAVWQALQSSWESQISVFQGLSQSPKCASLLSRGWERGCCTKLMALQKVRWTIRQRTLTACYSWFCSVLTFCYWTWPQTIQPVRVTNYFFCLINELM